MLKRTFDLILSFIILSIVIIPSICIFILVKLTSKGPALYWSDRIGINNTIFKMPKFRSMQFDTPQVATHLLQSNQDHLTLIGPFLRKSSLDEIPQLFSIIIGDMSFVGPRPALFNQNDLIDLRGSFGIDKIKPGLTGWAQINGRDELSITQKVKFDRVYLKKASFLFDLKILFLTFYRVALQKGIHH